MSRNLIAGLTFLSLIVNQNLFSQEMRLTVNMGHTDDIWHLLYSPDGKYIITGSHDKTIKIWDAATGREIRTLSGHTSQIKSLAMTPDGKNILSVDYVGKKIIVWDIFSGKEILTIKNDGDELEAIVISPNGKYVFAKQKHDFFQWSVQTGQQAGKYDIYYQVHAFKDITGMAISPDGKYMAASYEDSAVRMWDIVTEKIIKTFPQKQNIISLRYSPNGKYLLMEYPVMHEEYASERNGTGLLLADAVTGREVWTFSGKSGTSNIQYAFNPDGKTILAGEYYADASEDNFKIESILLDAATGKVIRSIPAEVWSNSLSFSPDGKYYATVTDVKYVKIWDAKTDQLVRTFSGDAEQLWAAAISPDGNYLLTGAWRINLWNLNTGKEHNSYKQSDVNFITISPDSKYAVSASMYNSPVVWDIATENELTSLYDKKIEYSPRDFLFGPDSNQIISAHSDGKIFIWKVDPNSYSQYKGKIIKTIEGHSDIIFSMAMSPDKKTIVTGSEDQTIKLWDINTGNELKTFTGHEGWVVSVAFSPDGKTILSGSMDSTLKLWDASTGNEIRTFSKHESFLNSVAFSPDGKTIVSGAADNLIKIWDVNTGRVIHTLTGHTNWVRKVMFTPDGKFLISASRDGVIKFWNPVNGQLILTGFAFGEGDDFIVVTPDGRFDGTEKGMKLVHFVKGMEVIPVESLFEHFYTPNLLLRTLKGETLAKADVDIQKLLTAPKVQITSPNNNFTSSTPQVTVTVKANDQGGGIDEIKLFHNGKLLETTGRGMIKAVSQSALGKEITKTFTLTLVTGENKIRATAFNSQRTEAIPDELTLRYEGAKTTANLYLLVVGVNKYKNPQYSLSYAVADAGAFKSAVESGAGSIFNKVEAVYIQDDEAVKTKLLSEFQAITAKARQEDVFIFFYAGHGVMSEEDQSKFYIIPYDVTQMYGDNQMLKNKAVSADEIQEFSKSLKAQKQLFVIDACQSGGMVTMLAARGAAEEKAIAQLARSTGTYWIMASGSDQMAQEQTEIGHGFFTFSILQGLQGEAEGGSKDSKITVEELSAYVKDQVPNLCEKYKRQAQFPRSFGSGMDFPVVIVK